MSSEALKLFTLKRVMKVSEVQFMRRIGTEIDRLNIKAITSPDDLMDITRQITAKQQEQDEKVVSLLSQCYDAKEEEILDMANPDMITLFTQLWEKSTVAPKNSKEPLPTPSSSETTTLQK